MIINSNNLKFLNDIKALGRTRKLLLQFIFEPRKHSAYLYRVQ